jgi:predicted nucleic acid-binding protein
MPTRRLVVDSWAWLEIFNGSEKGKKAAALLSASGEVFTHAVTLAEVVSTVARRGRPVDDARLAIQASSKVLVPSSEDAVRAGLLHAQMKKRSPNFSLADAFALDGARSVGAKVLTGDPDFAGVKEAVLLH